MKLDIFGIGGAFIDLTFHVSDAHIEKLGIRKGGISFVSSQQQSAIISELHNTLTSVSHGGSVANSIYTAQRLGTRCAFSSSIGDDEHGRAFAAELARYGVVVACDLLSGATTNSVLSLITPEGEKTFVVSPELAGAFRFDDVPCDILASSSWLLVEGQLFSYGEDSKLTAIRCIQFARERGIQIALNLGSVSVVEAARDLLIRQIRSGALSLLIGNSEEFESLYNETDIASCLASVEQTVPLVISTLGAQGVVARHNAKTYSVPISSKCQVVDTSGAGDAFLGTLLGSLCNNDRDLPAILSRANDIASRVVAQAGTRLENFPV